MGKVNTNISHMIKDAQLNWINVFDPSAAVPGA